MDNPNQSYQYPQPKEKPSKVWYVIVAIISALVGGGGGFYIANVNYQNVQNSFNNVTTFQPASSCPSCPDTSILYNQITDLQNQVKLSIITVTGTVSTKGTGTQPTYVNFADFSGVHKFRVQGTNPYQYSALLPNNRVYTITVDYSGIIGGTCTPTQSRLDLRETSQTKIFDLGEC